MVFVGIAPPPSAHRSMLQKDRYKTMMKLNEKLQELRKQKGLTQEELAAALYVSRTAISKWESGRGYPSIESLQALAKFFSVTVDELLSTNEVLTIAERDSRQKESHFRDLVFGFSDLCMAMLLFLPLFAERGNGSAVPTALLSLTTAHPALKITFFAILLALSAVGVLTLALQNCQAAVWLRGKTALSLSLGAIAVLCFAIGLHPYAAVFAFLLLGLKTVLLLQHR